MRQICRMAKADPFRYVFPGKLEQVKFSRKTGREFTPSEWFDYILDAFKNGKMIMLYRPKYLKGKRIKK